MGARSWKCNSFVEIKLIFKDDLCWSIFNLEVPNPFSCLCLEFSSLTQTPLNLLFRTWWICGSSSPCNCAMWLMSWLARMSLHATAKGWKVQVAWACEKSNLMVDLMDWRDGVVGVICQEFQEKSPRSPVFCLMSSIAELQTLDKCLGSLQQPFLLMSLSSSSKTVGFLEETSWLSGMRWSKIQRIPPSDGFSLLLLPEASPRMDDGFPSFFWKQNRPFRVFFSMAEPVFLSDRIHIWQKCLRHDSSRKLRVPSHGTCIFYHLDLFSDFQDLESRKRKSQRQCLQAELLHLVGDSQISILLIDPGSRRPTQCRCRTFSNEQCSVELSFPQAGESQFLQTWRCSWKCIHFYSFSIFFNRQVFHWQVVLLVPWVLGWL